MKILEKTIEAIPKPKSIPWIFGIPILLVILPLIILFLVLVGIFVLLSYPFRILRKQPNITYNPKDRLLIQTLGFELRGTELYLLEEEESYAERFYWNTDSGHERDARTIYKVNVTEGECAIHDQYITDFKIETHTELIVQLITDTPNSPGSELVSINKITGELTTITEIGKFMIHYIDQKTNELVGINKEERIRIKIDGVELAEGVKYLNYFNREFSHPQ